MPAGETKIAVTLAQPWTDVAPLRLWLASDFLVCSADPWQLGPAETLAALGPFVLAPDTGGRPDGADLAQSGYPFFTGTVRYRGEVFVPTGGVALALELQEVRGAAARVTWDGRDFGWTWGPRWAAPLEGRIEQGSHLLEVELYTTSFNLFGPPHHVLGDPPLVTTSHYTGQRDFAQPRDRELLLVPETHVLPTGLAPAVTILWEAQDVH